MYEVEVFCFDEKMGVGYEEVYYRTSHLPVALWEFLKAKHKYNAAHLVCN